ncbi:MAG: dienelactone hydrolase family protein [Chthoniobacterales bacterium]
MNGKFFLALIGAALTLASGVSAEEEVRLSQTPLQTSAGRIRTEIFEPAAGARRPAIVVLHGAGGTIFDGPEMRRVARHLAGAGNVVYVVHYFDATGTLFARDAVMQENFEVWLRTVRESVAAVQDLRRDQRPIGVYGYSLGAFLALAAASDNPRIGAVVEHAGGVWNGKMERLHHLPPVLMIHGRRDARVPFAQYAEPLLPVLRARARSVQTRFFAEETHVFTPVAMVEVRAAAAAFFRRYLAPGPVVR